MITGFERANVLRDKLFSCLLDFALNFITHEFILIIGRQQIPLIIQISKRRTKGLKYLAPNINHSIPRNVAFFNHSLSYIPGKLSNRKVVILSVIEKSLKVG
ncbi:MAG: hypothetical protein DRJ60_06520 [Thermoprotei archaeon]|nr:MAG: hypothetical protein DRJ60_06520 [Thermoprotei archaeon]